MASLSCPNGAQSNWCPQTTDDVLPSVIGLLPPGPAWSAAGVAGTVQNTYWRSLANLLGYTYGRLCAYVDEFYCKTVNESMDQWIAEFGLDDDCDPYGHNLCIKVAADGGNNCEYFTQMALLSGLVITCRDISKEAEPIAGCFQVGCTSLGPTPVFNPYGSNLGYGQSGNCNFGEVVQHPDPSQWSADIVRDVYCTVPGSNLGQGPDAQESCCFIVGYYDFDPVEVPVDPDYCQNNDTTIRFDCPRQNVPSDPLVNTVRRRIQLDASGNYVEWGNAHIWEVTVDLAASQTAALTTVLPPDDGDQTISAAGRFMVGEIVFSTDGTIGGTPLCTDVTEGPLPDYFICALDRIKPAHTQLNVKVLQP